MVEEVEYDTRKIGSVIKKNMLTPCIRVILQNLNYRPHYSYSSYGLLDVHGSVHHNINLTEITNKMRPRSRIYYSSVS
jgi:hypothetical protein